MDTRCDVCCWVLFATEKHFDVNCGYLICMLSFENAVKFVYLVFFFSIRVNYKYPKKKKIRVSWNCSSLCGHLKAQLPAGSLLSNFESIKWLLNFIFKQDSHTLRPCRANVGKCWVEGGIYPTGKVCVWYVRDLTLSK